MRCCCAHAKEKDHGWDVGSKEREKEEESSRKDVAPEVDAFIGVVEDVVPVWYVARPGAGGRSDGAALF